MLTDKKIFGKLEQIENRYNGVRYEVIASVPMRFLETREHFRAEPGDGNWSPAPEGTHWGGDWMSAWFSGDARIPAEFASRRVFVRAQIGGETLFLVDGTHMGVFDANHPVVQMTPSADPSHTYHLAFEAYSGHTFPGTQPGEHTRAQGRKVFSGVQIVIEREDVSAFVFNLRALRQVMLNLDENSLRRNQIAHELGKIYACVNAMPEERAESTWRPNIRQANELMQPLLAATNGSTMPKMGIIGHSHIDTAWLWPLAETWRKCARTFSSMLNLMEQYPELLFIQSQPCQTEMMRELYPGIYSRMQGMVASGRWEPNGGMWVEPDCNIPSGESFVRQLLIGQQATREFFGYTSDTLWLPDVFGYSAALPQILQGAGIQFFCTTKIAWNDTTRFPYDTFIWKGIDGSSVIAHYNAIHCWPDPATLIQQWNWVQHKDVQDRRLSAFGFGDGGGGPMAEMAEMARRVHDLEGCPRAEYTTVSRFMQGIRDELSNLPVWSGELYLELHRGTLTSISEIKRGNRKTEFALREAEFVSTLARLNGVEYPAESLKRLWKELLLNQFHDILPGSSIAEVNDQAIEAFIELQAKATSLTTEALSTFGGQESGAEALLISNNLSWERKGELTITSLREPFTPADTHLPAQWVSDVTGTGKLVVGGMSLPALGISKLPVRPGVPAEQPSSFMWSDDQMETPFARVKFDAAGRITSFVVKESGHEVVRSGGVLNALFSGEDIPEAWDNWDIDRDQTLKMHEEKHLLSRELVANGPLQCRIRSTYRIGEASQLTQDMVFHATTAQVDFETLVDWHEKHTLLKAGFALNVVADTARHEIQYGHVERPTHANLPQDRARFEVCAHKWTDLSDNGFGVALLNDCKYGISVDGSDLRLSLIKSGTHPDARGDEGRHSFTYSLLPHSGPFSVEAVVRLAYELNVQPVTLLTGASARETAGLLSVDAPNVIVESVKWAEKAAEQANAFVVRLYEAGKASGSATIHFNVPIKKVSQTNLLEENAEPLTVSNGSVSFSVRPFEIVTLVCEVDE